LVFETGQVLAFKTALMHEPSYQPEKKFHPGSRLILILGIFSIIGCWMYGIVGLISGLFSLYLAKIALSIHQQQEQKYGAKALKIIKQGQIYAIIGVFISILYLIVLFIKIIA
jgi:hypothetical protein